MVAITITPIMVTITITPIVVAIVMTPIVVAAVAVAAAADSPRSYFLFWEWAVLCRLGLKAVIRISFK
jgi:hypothetical protein